MQYLRGFPKGGTPGSVKDQFDLYRNTRIKNISQVSEKDKTKIGLIIEMNYPAASCGVSKTARNEASFGEFTRRD